MSSSSFTGDPLSWAEMLAGLGPPPEDLAERRERLRAHYYQHALVLGEEPGSTSPDETRTNGEPMPNTAALHPDHNPHRQRDAMSVCASAPPYADHLTLQDVEVLLADRERRGIATGYRERDSVMPRQLADAYDDGWRSGMLDQHSRAAAVFGDRLHLLHDLLDMLPTLTQSGAQLGEALAIASGVVGSVISGHGAGPFGLRPGPPADEAMSVVVPAGDDEGDEAAAARYKEEWMRARVGVLRDYLKQFIPEGGDEA